MEPSKSAGTSYSIDPIQIGDNYGPEFERAVLWLCLNDPSFGAIAFRTIGPEVFSTERDAVVFATGQQIFNNAASSNGRISHVTAVCIMAEIVRAMKRTSDGSSKKTTYTDCVKLLRVLMYQDPLRGITAEYIKKTFSEFVTKSKVREALIASAGLWESNDFAAIQEKITAAVRTIEHTQDMDVGVRYFGLADRLKQYKVNSLVSGRFPVGIQILDDKMRGGMERKKLGVIMGMAGRGKSQLVASAACAAIRHGLKVAIATLELSAIDYSQRIDSNLTGVPLNQIASFPDHYRADLARASVKTQDRLYLKEWGSNEANVMDIYLWLRALENKVQFHPDVLFVDYAELLRIPEKRGDRIDLGTTMRKLRQLAKDLDIAVWTPAQTNRKSFTSSLLSFGDIGEDVQIVQVADVVIGLCQTDLEKRSAPQRMRLVLLKNRIGGREGAVVDCESYTDTMSIVQCANQRTFGKSGAGKP